MIVFRFGWGDGSETFVKVRVGTPAEILATSGDRSQLPDFSSYRSIHTMRAEAQFFAAVRHCKLTIEQ